jgi:HEAT repeat protein
MTTPFISVATLVAVLAASASAQPEDDPKPGSEPAVADPVRAAFEQLEKACKDKDWRAEDAASKALAAIGDPAVQAVMNGAEDHLDARVRRACYSLLTDRFRDNPWAIQTVIRNGLSDEDGMIRYECAFRLGELKVYQSHRELRKVMEQARAPEALFLRYAAAKSLAQLGEADILRTLFEAVTNDAYMPRSMGNAGLKALSGKNLEDFDGYHFGEGAFVSGGKEAASAFDAVSVAEKKAGRFQAATSYFKWLQKERPDLYKHLTGEF